MFRLLISRFKRDGQNDITDYYASTEEHLVGARKRLHNRRSSEVLPCDVGARQREQPGRGFRHFGQTVLGGGHIEQRQRDRVGVHGVVEPVRDPDVHFVREQQRLVYSANRPKHNAHFLY